MIDFPKTVRNTENFKDMIGLNTSLALRKIIKRVGLWSDPSCM